MLALGLGLFEAAIYRVRKSTYLAGSGTVSKKLPDRSNKALGTVTDSCVRISRSSTNGSHMSSQMPRGFMNKEFAGAPVEDRAGKLHHCRPADEFPANRAGLSPHRRPAILGTPSTAARNARGRVESSATPARPRRAVWGRTLIIVGTASLLALATAPPVMAAAVRASAVPGPCAQMATPIYQVIKPGTSSLLTPWNDEARKAAASYGFTQNGGTPFNAATRPGPGLVAVHRMYSPTSQDFVWISDPDELIVARDRLGFQDQQIDFYASVTPNSCLVPVWRLSNGTFHRHLTDKSKVDALAKQGWRNEGVTFWAAPSGGSSALPSPSPSPTPVPPGQIRPSGTGIVPFESLPDRGSVPNTVNAVPGSAQVSFLPGTYSFSDFAMGAYELGFLVWRSGSSGPAGLRGSGPDRTVLQMRPQSSRQAAKVPPQSSFASGDVNPLYLLRADGGTVLSGFELRGSEQSHLYNGLMIYHGNGAAISDVRVTGIPGNNSANPGETFSINLLRSAGTQMSRIEIDGRNATGNRVAASGVGINFGNGTVINDLNVHDMRYGHALAAYTTSDLTLTRPRLVNNVQALNFERVSGTVRVTQPYFHGNATADGSPNYDLSIANDQGSAQYIITDPTFDGPKLMVQVTGYLGNRRTQDPRAVRLFIGGRDRPDLLQVNIEN